MASGGTIGTVVLVIEDEPILRMMALDLVEEAGFEAVEARNADEAVRALEARPDIRIVFSDIDLGVGIDGIKLARAIRDRWPPVEIIMTSGKVKPGPGDLPERGLFFDKPYRREEVTAAIRKLAA